VVESVKRTTVDGYGTVSIVLYYGSTGGKRTTTDVHLAVVTVFAIVTYQRGLPTLALLITIATAKAKVTIIDV
jgi:hypothetical protein